MAMLDPRISEFESTEVAERYDPWFRAKVELARAGEGPAIPHDQVIGEMRALIEAAELRRG